MKWQARDWARLCVFGVILGNACVQAADLKTALDRYVAEPDPAYHYELVKEISGPGFTQYVIDMTSQTWLTPQEVNRTAWQHWVRIVKPDVVEHETGLLIIAGGSNGKSAPTDIDKRLAAIALETRSVVTELKMVPNEPLEFTDDNGRRRTEDEIIAYGWDKHLRGGRDEWLARLPMTKSAVRAMDTISEFMGREARGSVKVQRRRIARP